jgi:hypothetical protein
MLQNLDDQVRDCLERARECADRAKATRNPNERKEWLAIEARYLSLVQSIEFTRRLNLFTNEAKKKSWLEPEAIDCMLKAYRTALSRLGPANRDDAVIRLLAEKIIEVVQTGERDPVRISERAIGSFGTRTL